MFFIQWRQPRTKTRHTGRQWPRLEPLEDRTLLTLFTVSAAPDAAVDLEATATVTYTSGEVKLAQASLAGDASPVGMGDHHGAFYLGAPSDLLQIDSIPGDGQNLGDPIKVGFTFSYTSLLQSFFGYPPANPSYVEWHGFLDAGAATQPLFDGLFSTDFTPGDETRGEGLIPIEMNVGDSIIVHVWSNGQAYTAEPHFKARVAFNADFSVSDLSNVDQIQSHPTPEHLHLFSLGAHLEHFLGPDGMTDKLTETSGKLAAYDVDPLDINLSQTGSIVAEAGREQPQHAAGQRPAADNLIALILETPEKSTDLVAAL
jgi:hypothetical protein